MKKLSNRNPYLEMSDTATPAGPDHQCITHALHKHCDFVAEKGFQELPLAPPLLLSSSGCSRRLLLFRDHHPAPHRSGTHTHPQVDTNGWLEKKIYPLCSSLQRACFAAFASIFAVLCNTRHTRHGRTSRPHCTCFELASVTGLFFCHF